MVEPWISVVVPTYNRKDSLRVTLDGLGRQTLPRERFEVIVVSDGSTDGTEAFLAEYAASAVYRLRSITQENAGPARARNRGIQEATGEVIVMLDDDVEPASDLLERHAKHHGGNVRVAAFGPMVPDPARRDLEPPWIGWEHAMLRKQYESWDRGAWTSAGPHNFYSGNASVRREFLLAVGGFNEEMKRQEDIELAWRLRRECGVEVVYDPAPLGVHRPSRSFASWLAIADAYGRLDVVRARSGDGTWDTLRENFENRSRVTQTLARIVYAAPWTLPLLTFMLKGVSQALYRLRRDNAAYAVLSALYNVQYLSSARREMGGPLPKQGKRIYKC